MLDPEFNFLYLKIPLQKKNKISRLQFPCHKEPFTFGSDWNRLVLKPVWQEGSVLEQALSLGLSLGQSEPN